jgi:outer membrane lipoprotein carrier protein
VLSAARLSLGPLACALLAACGNSSPPGATGSSGAVSSEPHPTAVTTAPSATVTATASATAPAASVEPAPTTVPAASAVPADAGAPHDAGAKPAKVAAAADAGAADAGLAVDAGAAVSPALAIAQQIDAIFAAKKTFSARFKQQLTLHVTNGVETSSGTVVIERPSKISFRYDPPKKNRIVSDGTTLRVYIADDKQMIETPMQRTEYPGALGFMMGTGISRSFDFSFNPRNTSPDIAVLDGKPLAPNPSYEQVRFFVDKALLGKSDPGAMRAVTLIDAQQNHNRFEFEGVTQPASIPPDEFTFTPPPGTDIVRR